jgi:hypothetical protein
VSRLRGRSTTVSAPRRILESMLTLKFCREFAHPSSINFSRYLIIYSGG